ncbi:MAG: SMC-Scp complex subunit ScpB [Rhodospirillaceae bacterium]|nr:SMC-Scp complex subunit ScpB [Rhodospirillaceae bacterium]
MSDALNQNLKLIEAYLFSSEGPVAEKSLAHRLPEGTDIEPLMVQLQEHYADRGINLVKAGGSWAFRTAPDMTTLLNREIDVQRKLGRATIETLAIIAYHQPVTRGEIEEIRGVSLSKGTLDTLFEEGWVRPRGRRKTPGRPTTWGTTDVFLDHFGLESIKDLPGTDELKAAGLLDKRPAIDAYRVSGTVAATADEERGETDEEPENGILPLAPHLAEGDENEAPEPLDPDAG